MFARFTLPLIAVAAALPVLATSPMGNFGPQSAQEPTIPVTIDLSEVEARPGPLYISIQKEKEFQGMRGYGGIIQSVGGSADSVTYKVDVPGEYAVSLWHDLNDDGVFSMDESYRIEDGWGASGDVTQSSRPTFSKVSFDVPAHGTDVSVRMFYPE